LRGQDLGYTCGRERAGAEEMTDKHMALSASGRETATGIHISGSGMSVVRLSRGQVVDIARIPFEPGVTPASESFAPFLRKTLVKACAGMRRTALWVGYAFPSMHVRHFTVPRVPARQLSNAVFWTFRKELPFDEESTIFDFIVDGEVEEDGVRKMSVTAHMAMRSEVEACRAAFESAGFPPSGITLPFFAYMNLFRAAWVAGMEPVSVFMDVGSDSTQVAVVADKKIQIVRSIKAGSDSLFDAIRSDHSCGVSPGELQTFLSGGPAGQLTPELQAKVLAVIKPPLVRIMRQVERTLEAHFLGPASDHVKRLHIGGAIAAARPIVDFMSVQTGMPVEPIQPVDQTRMGRKLAESELTDPEKILLAPAIGLALSSLEYTPNLLLTRLAMDEKERTSRLTLTILTAGILAAMALLGVHQGERACIRKKTAEQNSLLLKLEQMKPSVSEQKLADAATKAGARFKRLKETAREAVPVAMLADIAAMTPEGVHISAISAEFRPDPDNKAAEDAGSSVIIEGTVTGQPGALDSILAHYMAVLGKSPLLSNIRIQGTSVPDSDGLRFALKALIVSVPEEQEKENK